MGSSDSYSPTMWFHSNYPSNSNPNAAHTLPQRPAPLNQLNSYHSLFALLLNDTIGILSSIKTLRLRLISDLIVHSLLILHKDSRIVKTLLIQVFQEDHVQSLLFKHWSNFLAAAPQAARKKSHSARSDV